LIINCATKEVETVEMTAEEVAIKQAETDAEMSKVVYEPINEEMNAIIDGLIDLDARVTALEGGI
jgi:hypothetical protein